ncbi:MAG TPA: hemerythrin domain-containing protein [Thermoanaerobaculia bacterium]
MKRSRHEPGAWMSSAVLLERLTAEHRRLDDLFGQLLAAMSAGDAVGARGSSEAFDDALRSHTREEEEEVFPAVSGEGLVPSSEESPSHRLYRQLRLEHVQIRELSGMIRRLLSEGVRLDEIPGLAANLARRWDAHTTREEKEGFSQRSGT